MTNGSSYPVTLARHYERNFGSRGTHVQFSAARGYAFEAQFSVFRFEVNRQSGAFLAYATVGLALPPLSAIELHCLIPPPARDFEIAEVLYAIGLYVDEGNVLGEGHMVNFGRPLISSSNCTRGLISKPYPFGPGLEAFVADNKEVRCLWLLPITESERKFAIDSGVEALEEEFDRAQLDYLNLARAPVV